MYTAMVFHPTGINNNSTVRAIRQRPYSDISNAIAAINRSGMEGYIKQQGRTVPVWNNVQKATRITLSGR